MITPKEILLSPSLSSPKKVTGKKEETVTYLGSVMDELKRLSFLCVCLKTRRQTQENSDHI